MTPASGRILAWLRSERDFWHGMANEDELNTFTRHGAISRRDQLDMILQRLPRELDMVEAETVLEASGVAEWLESGAGVPAA